MGFLPHIWWSFQPGVSTSISADHEAHPLMVLSVTLGMCLIGAMSWFRGLLIVISQIAGAISSAGIVSVLFPGPSVIRTTLGGGTKVVQGLFIEMFLTAQLVFTIFMLAAEKHKATYIAPIGIGLSLFIAELTGTVHAVFCLHGRTLMPLQAFIILEAPSILHELLGHVSSYTRSTNTIG